VSTKPFVDTPHNWALRDEDSNAADSAPNTSTLAGYTQLEENGPNTRSYLLGTPIPTTPRSKSVSPIPNHCIKGIGRGKGIKRKGENNSIVTITIHCPVSTHLILLASNANEDATLQMMNIGTFYSSLLMF